MAGYRKAPRKYVSKTRGYKAPTGKARSMSKRRSGKATAAFKKGERKAAKINTKYRQASRHVAKARRGMSTARVTTLQRKTRATMKLRRLT